MRLPLLAVLAAIMMAGCASQEQGPPEPQVSGTDSSLMPTLPGEANLPPQWIYMAKTARPATAAYNAHGMQENPGPADPAAFEARGGAMPDEAVGALFLLRSSDPLETLYVFSLDFGSEETFRDYLANTNYCNRADDFALVGNGAGKAALAVGANLSDANGVLGALGSWWAGQGFTPAC